MQAWISALLGLMALICPAGSQDSHLLDFEDSSLSVPLLREGRRQLQTASLACPNIMRNSLSACDRCLSNEMCPYTDKQWICNHYSKRCTHPDWDGNATTTNCPEQLSDYSQWGALCKELCDDQRSPFSCAARCLNEDYPCKWVTNCFANVNGDMTGMTPDSSACLRSCQDHDSMLRTTLTSKGFAQAPDVYNCGQAVSIWGCNNLWGAETLEHCPQTCRAVSGECAWRCGRDELVNENNEQCWQVVQRAVNDDLTYTCALAISAGMDCHCKCANAYLQLARAGGGAFKAGTFFGDHKVEYNRTYVANTTFSLAVSGQAMRETTVDDSWGPRLKIIVRGQDCRYAQLITMEGLICDSPPPGSASAETGVICQRGPTIFSSYNHRWNDLRISSCGIYDVCHCNHKCDLARNWHHAGSVTLTPPVEVGSVKKAMPGCQREVVPWTRTGGNGIAEAYVTTVTTFSLTLSGGLKETDRRYIVPAAREAMAPMIQHSSVLMNAQVPHMRDPGRICKWRIDRQAPAVQKAPDHLRG